MLIHNDLLLSDIQAIVNEAQANPRNILKEINLRISPHEWISIVGKNGSGKSTLAQVLAGVRQPSGGTFQRGFTGNAPIPYVMQQELQWFGLTPMEDIIFLLESRGEASELIPGIAKLALQSVGIEALANRSYTEMSGGQQQLAAIAGCIAAKAPLLILDEATSMLDSNARLLVLETVKKLNQQGTAIVWLTHHMEDLCYGDRVIALADGHIKFDGDPTSFFYRTFSLESGQSPCEELGFVLPFAIQVANVLKRQGMLAGAHPLTPLQLQEVVRAHA